MSNLHPYCRYCGRIEPSAIRPVGSFGSNQYECINMTGCLTHRPQLPTAPPTPPPGGGIIYFRFRNRECSARIDRNDTAEQMWSKIQQAICLLWPGIGPYPLHSSTLPPPAPARKAGESIKEPCRRCQSERRVVIMRELTPTSFCKFCGDEFPL